MLAKEVENSLHFTDSKMPSELFGGVMKSIRNIAVGIMATALMLAGCSAADQQEAKKGNGETVTIVTHDSFALKDEDIAKFEKESGYKLKTISAGDGTVVNNLKLNKKNPTVDGFYGIDTFHAQQVIDDDLAIKYVPKGFKSKYIVGDRLIPIDRGDVCLNTHDVWFKDKGLEAPKTFDDLLKPEYKNLLVLTDPLTSSPGFAFLAATVAEKGDGWKDYWTALLKNGAKVADSWSTAYFTDFSGADGKGAYPIVLSYSSSPAYAGGTTSSVNSTCIEQVEYAGVVKGAKNEAGAKAFVDFLLSDSVQTNIPETMYMYPIKSGIELPADYAKYAPLPKKSLSIDLKKVSDSRKQWLDEWSKLYKATK